MAPRPGTRARRASRSNPSPRGGRLAAAGRGAGFLMLAGPGLVILAAVVLLPAYARLSRVRYELRCLQASVADAEALAAAYDRMIAALPRDEVLALRMAMNQEAIWPRSEVVVVDPSAAPSPPPGVVAPPEPHPRPAPPSPRLLGAAAKLDRPQTRRGLFAVAAGALLAAMFLFAPPDGKRRAAGET